MKRLNGNVGPTKAALQERPKVFHSVHMDASAHIGLSLVDHIMDELPIHASIVSNRIVRIEPRTILHVLENHILQSLACHVRYHCGADLAKVAVKDALYDGLVLKRATPFDFLAASLVHVLGESTDERLVRLKFCIWTAKFLSEPKRTIVQRSAKPP